MKMTLSAETCCLRGLCLNRVANDASPVKKRLAKNGRKKFFSYYWSTKNWLTNIRVGKFSVFVLRKRYYSKQLKLMMRPSRVIPYVAMGMLLLISDLASAQTTTTFGTSSSSSSTRGPLQRSDSSSTTVFSRWVMVYTASELSTAGIASGASITELKWELASSNVIIGTGDADLKVYIKNSTATDASSDTWSNLTSGSSLVVDTSFNTTNNFPGSNGWMPFTFDAPFTYNGGALEIAVDWDCSNVTTPVFSGDGAIKWRWTSTAPDDLVVKKTASSSAPSTISDVKDERANMQIVYNVISCKAPTSLNVHAQTASAALNWKGDSQASAYNWKIVEAGKGSGSAAIDSGSTMNDSDMATALSAFTSYDLYVASDCGTNGASTFAGPYSFMTLPQVQTAATIGTGSSSSSTRGPLQRSDSNSSTVFSRWVNVYTASELAKAGISMGDSITALNWELASSNIIVGSGDATLKVYIKNSTATAATSDTWDNLTTGSSLVVDKAFNTTNNFPGANGWMPFNFSEPFNYTGGALEIAVDWDCSQVSTPSFSGDGALKWRWTSTAPDDLVAKKTASSSAPSTISDLSDERANIQIVYAVTSCALPVGLTAGTIDTTSADLSWNSVIGSDSYFWKIVPSGSGSGAAAIDSGVVTADTMASATGLATGTSYDVYVQGNCGAIGESSFAGPYSFTTLCGKTPPTAIDAVITNVSCNGDNNGAIDLTVTAGVAPFQFAWSNSETTEDINGLTAGQYKLTVTDGNGCPYFDSLVITEPMALMVSGTSTPDTANGNTGAISVMASGGTAPYTYLWSRETGPADSTGLAAGTYSVVVKDANDCADSVEVIVDQFVGLGSIDYFSGLSIAPNPTQGIANIELDLSESAQVLVAVYTPTGKLVETLLNKNVSQLRYPVQFSSYENGVYFVRVSVNGQTTMKRVLFIK